MLSPTARIGPFGLNATECYIGERDVQEIDGGVCDALHAKLLTEGRVAAKPKTAPARKAVHVRRATADGKIQPCHPCRYDALRWYRVQTDLEADREGRHRQPDQPEQRSHPRCCWHGNWHENRPLSLPLIIWPRGKRPRGECPNLTIRKSW